MLFWLTLALVGSNGTVQWLGPRPTQIKRIVSLAPSTTEVLFAIGAGPRVVGVTRFDDYPPAVAELPRVGGFVDPDPESVMALSPDLVVAVPHSGGRNSVEILARLGAPVLVVPGESLADLWTTVETLGEVTGCRGAARSLLHDLRHHLNALRAQNHAQPRVRALVVVGHRPIVAAGPGTFFDSMLQLLNTENVIQRGGAYPLLDAEALAVMDPDVVIDLTVGTGGQDALFWRGYRQVRAVREGRLVRLADPALVRPGPRLPAGLEKLAAALRPTH